MKQMEKAAETLLLFKRERQRDIRVVQPFSQHS